MDPFGINGLNLHFSKRFRLPTCTCKIQSWAVTVILIFSILKNALLCIYKMILALAWLF